jgi:hypothetical protein
MNRGVYLLFVSVVGLSLSACAVGTEGQDPPAENGKTVRSGTIETPSPAGDAPEAVIEVPFFDEQDTRPFADNPFAGKEPGLPPPTHSHIPTPKTPGQPHH